MKFSCVLAGQDRLLAKSCMRSKQDFHFCAPNAATLRAWLAPIGDCDMACWTIADLYLRSIALRDNAVQARGYVNAGEVAAT